MPDQPTIKPNAATNAEVAVATTAPARGGYDKPGSKKDVEPAMDASQAGAIQRMPELASAGLPPVHPVKPTPLSRIRGRGEAMACEAPPSSCPDAARDIVELDAGRARINAATDDRDYVRESRIGLIARVLKQVARSKIEAPPTFCGSEGAVGDPTSMAPNKERRDYSCLRQVVDADCVFLAANEPDKDWEDSSSNSAAKDWCFNSITDFNSLRRSFRLQPIPFGVFVWGVR